ncbi:MAG: flagellar assembly protein FliW [Bdellovibrionaceae bacterium]|nr:flagellar assembly protein FliW [Pseudobdellovibrionaceae bacterium]
MDIQTSRFGNIKVTGEDILNFPEGLLGFSDLNRFVLLDDPTDEIFAWLQSCDEPSIAFPVLEPELFLESFSMNLTKGDLKGLHADTISPLRSFCIITIPEDPTQMTANVKAPVVINVTDKIGRQCVLQDNKLEIREPIFTKLQQRVVTHNPSSIKSKAVETGVAVTLPSEKTKEQGL